MEIFTRDLGFLNVNNEEMQWFKFNGVIVYEAFKKLIGVPPLTLLNSKGVDLVDYKIYGKGEKYIELPSEYQQVEYIESTGTQYIDTGFIATNNTRTRIKFRTPPTIPTDVSTTLFYSSAPVGNYGFALGSSAGAGKYRGFYGSNSYSSPDMLVTTTDYVLDFNKEKMYLNETLIHTFPSVSFTTEYSIPLFAQYYKSSNAINLVPSGTRLYRVEIWENDIPARDLIPCYRKSDNTIGLYDLVNSVFYPNLGSGEFVKGSNSIGVGDKSSNIADLSKTIVSSATPNRTFKYDNKTGTLELTSKPTQYDYTLIYIENDSGLGVKLETGKTYYYGANVVVSGKTTSNNTIILFGIGYTNSLKGQITVNQNGIYPVKGSFVYDGQENLYLAMNFNYGSVEPAQVKFENIYFSEVDEYDQFGTYKIPIKSRGKKLNDISTDIIGYYINVSGVLVYDGVSSYSRLIPVKPNTSYTLSCDAESCYSVHNKRLHAYDKNGNWIQHIGHINYQAYETGFKEMTGITPSNCAYVRISHWTTYENYIQLEEGTVATENEPYKGVTKNIYLDEPLTINDYIDYKKQELSKNGVIINVELPNIPTLEGTTYIEVNTETVPSNMEVVYKGKL